MTAGDLVADSTTTDSDVLTVTVTSGTAAAGSATAQVIGVENTVFNYSNAGATTTTIDAIAGGTVTVNQLLAGASGDATVSGAQSLKVAAGTGVTGTLALTNVKAESAVVVDAGNAAAVNVATVTKGSVNVTGGSKLATVTVEGAAATVTTSNAAATVNAKGTAATTDTITVNAGAAVTIANDAVAVEGITVGGNGAATVATVTTTAATTYASAGTQDVTFKGNASIFTGKAITDGNGSAKTNLSIADALATADYSKAAVDKISFATAAAGAATLTLANGANLEFSVAPGQDVTLATKAAVAGDSVTITSVGATASLISDSTTAASETAFDSINFVANTTAVTGLKSIQTADLGNGVSAAATQTGALNVSGSKDVTVDTLSRVKTLDASALTGKLTVALDGTNDIQIIKVGSGGSAITNGTAAYGVTAARGVVTGGVGNDALTLVSGSYADFDGGAGTDTISLAGDLTNTTWTNVETVTLADDVTAAKLSQFSGKTFVMNGAKTFTFGTAAANLDTATVDLSALNIDNVTSITTNVSGGWKTSIASTTGLTFTGSSAADVVTGTANVDTINGGKGNDTITGGAGADVINGGTGSNTYVYTTGNVVAGETLTFSTTAADTETIKVVAATDMTALNGGALLTGLDAILLSNGATGTSASFLAAQVTGLTGTLTGVAGGGAETLIVNGTSGADSIDLSAFTATNAVTTINAGAGSDTIKGTNAADAIDLGASDLSKDTLIFASTAALNGADSVSNFLMGASTANGDVLNFEAFLTGASTTFSTTAVANNADATVHGVDWNNKISLIAKATITDTTDGALATGDFGTGKDFSGDIASGKGVVIVYDATGGAGVYYVTTDADKAETVTKVATLVGLSTNGYHADNMFIA